jgi:hypothetical protein
MHLCKSPDQSLDKFPHKISKTNWRPSSFQAESNQIAKKIEKKEEKRKEGHGRDIRKSGLFK